MPVRSPVLRRHQGLLRDQLANHLAAELTELFETPRVQVRQAVVVQAEQMKQRDTQVTDGRNARSFPKRTASPFSFPSTSVPGRVNSPKTFRARSQGGQDRQMRGTKGVRGNERGQVSLSQ